MAKEYQLGRERTRARQKTTVMINISLKRAVYDKLVQMQRALQRDIGEDHTVTLPSVIRRILYQHQSLRGAVHRYPPPDSGDDLVT